MLSKADIKKYRSLHMKKFRDREQLFLVQGDKILREVLSTNWQVERIIASDNYLADCIEAVSKHPALVPASVKDLERISSLQNAPDVLAVLHIPKHKTAEHKKKQGLSLCLDRIQDPGNLGAVMRVADWFGLTEIICSEDSVDLYNPKVIQASMGSFLRLDLSYVSLADYLHMLREKHPEGHIYAAGMKGENAFTMKWQTPAVLVMGNEGHGLAPNLEAYIDSTLHIPSYAKGSGPESLNLAVATGILLAEANRPMNTEKR